MQKTHFGNSLLLFLAALIWGTTFVAQSVTEVSPFTYNCMRFFVGSLVLVPCIALLDRTSHNGRKVLHFSSKELLGGLFCGIVLASASGLQQYGVEITSAGKAAFLTSLYVVFVPVLGLFTKRKVSPYIWGCVITALAGATLLSANFTGEDMFNFGDVLCFLCALAFSLHIVVIDRFSSEVDGVRMSCVQFFVAGLVSLPLMLIFDKPSVSVIADNWFSIGYAGVLSCGIAYTLQIIGQKKCPPATASIVLSLESVFGALSGAIILGLIGKDTTQLMNARELIGCLIVFIAVIFAQLPEDLIFRSRKKSKQYSEKV